MPLPAALIVSIVSTIIETAAQSPSANVAQYEVYKQTRTLPPEAKTGTMLPPQGDGSLTIDGKPMPLAPSVQFRSQRNLIVMPMTIQDASEVVYLTDANGAIFRVWMVSAAELSALPKN